MSTERLICDEKVEECCSQDKVNKDEDVRATLHGTETHCCGSHKPEQVPASNTSNYNASDVSVTTTRLRVQGICCGQEAELVKTLLIPLEGVVSVSVNVVARTAVVRHDEKLLLNSDLVKILNDYHLGVSILQSGTAVSDRGKTTFFTSHTTAISLLLLVLCLFSVVIFANFYNQQWKIWVTVTLIVIASLPILKRAFNSWRKGIFLDVNILMLVAICGVAALKQWVEGATLVTVFYIADLLQSYCFYRVEEAVSKLAVESPLKAVCAVTKEPIDLDRVVPGTLLAICEGDKIPLDGIVTKGTGSVDECLITGEATPITKKKGDFTYSGTILQSGYLEIETTSTFENSTMAQITKMVQVSQGNATQAEATVNKFAKFYTPLVLLLAAAVFSIPLIIDVSENGSVDKKSFTIWTKRALMVLLVACPCALLMCIPIPVISCIVAAAKNGVLVKGGATVEALAFVKTVLFDKTGTLSEGKLRVNDVESYSDLLKAKDAMKEFMEIIAALEKKSNHPAATALVNFFFGCLAQYHSNNTEEVSTLPEVSKFENLPGLGIRGTVGDRDVLIGNLDLMKLFDVPCKKCNEDVLEWAGKGTSAVLIAVDGEVCMAVGLSDRPRSTAAAAVHALKNQSIEVLMVTGDGNGPASSIAREVGIDRVFSSMKPEDKLQLINTAKDKRKSPKDAIAMVGDGINDVPSLVASDVGIAVATSGVAITLESSDVVLINDNISKISSIILLSKRVHSICYQNVMLAIGIKAVTMIVIFSTQSGLWIAVLSDLLALITVVLNGLRPLIWRDKHGNWI